jgi:hypothetical protein
VGCTAYGVDLTVGTWLTYGSAYKAFGYKWITEKCATDDHGCHSLSDTPGLKFKICMLVIDSLEVKEWSAEVLSEEDKGASVR